MGRGNSHRWERRCRREHHHKYQRRDEGRRRRVRKRANRSSSQRPHWRNGKKSRVEYNSIVGEKTLSAHSVLLTTWKADIENNKKLRTIQKEEEKKRRAAEEALKTQRCGTEKLRMRLRQLQCENERKTEERMNEKGEMDVMMEEREEARGNVQRLKKEICRKKDRVWDVDASKFKDFESCRYDVFAGVKSEDDSSSYSESDSEDRRARVMSSRCRRSESNDTTPNIVRNWCNTLHTNGQKTKP
jgi:hypothetical protein